MRRQCVDNYSGPTTLGIDVSKYQGDIKWDEVGSLVKFVISRAGDGQSRDSKFQINWKKTGKLDFIRGTYQYFRADRDGKTQAEKVIDQIESAGGLKKTDLPPALDLEGGAIKNLPGGVFTGQAAELPIDLLVEECLEFLEVIENHYGVTPIVYTGQAFHWWLSQGRPDLAEKFTKYPLWLPSYSSCALMPVDRVGKGFPLKQWSIWQYSSKGTIGGIEGNVDINKFRGTEDQLKEFVKSLRHPKKQLNNEKIKQLLREGEKLAANLHEVFEKLRIELFV